MKLTLANNLQASYGKNTKMLKYSNDSMMHVFYLIPPHMKLTGLEYQELKNHDIHFANSNILPIVQSLEDLEKSIIPLVKKIKHDHTKILLVTNPQLANEILSNQSKQYLSLVSEIYIYTIDFEHEEQNIKRLQAKFRDKINKTIYKKGQFRYLVQEIRHLQNKFTDQANIFYNFVYLGGNSQQFIAHRYRIRLNGCIKIQEKDYRSYLQYTKEYFTSQTVSKQLITMLQYALKALQQKQSQKFIQILLQQYQKPSVFHKMINNGLRNFHRKQFEWKMIALPICLLYKAIKMHYQRKISILGYRIKFKQMTLWRMGKISENQKLQMKFNAKDRLFYEIFGFISTSLIKIPALLQHFDFENLQQNFIIKFKVKIPDEQYSLKFLQFINISFAELDNKQGNKEINENQVLLNIFTVGRLLSIQEVRLSALAYECQIWKQSTDNIQFLKIIQESSFKKKKQILEKSTAKILVVEIEIGNFQELLKYYTAQFKKSANQLTNQPPVQRQVVQNYLTSLDYMKSQKSSDIGYIYESCGQLQKAYDYYIQQMTIIQSEQSYLGKRQYFQLCQKLTNICYKLGKTDKALEYNDIAIQSYKLVHKLNQNNTYKKHRVCLNAMESKTYDYLQENLMFHQANQRIRQKITLYEQEEKNHPQNKLVYSFQKAKLLNKLGVIYFKEGKLKNAKNFVNQSKQMIDKIYKQIEYEKLKVQKFFGSYIFHWMFADAMWNGKNQYYQKKRVYNIQQATKIFGGDQELNNILSSSNQLKQKINTFILQEHCEEDLTWESNDVDNTVIKITLEKSSQKSSLIRKIQSKFSTHPHYNKLKPLLQNFFKEFSKIIIQQQSNQRLQKCKKEMMDILTSSTKYKTFQQLEEQMNKCQSLREQATFIKISNWQTQPTEIVYTHIYDFKEEINKLIHQKQDQNKRYIQKCNQFDRKAMKEYCQKVIGTISNHLNSEMKLENRDPFTIKLHQSLQKYYTFLDDQQNQMKQIQSIINLSNKNDNKIPYFDAYLCKIKIFYSKADIQFYKCLQNIPNQSRKQVIQMQQTHIKKCFKQLQQISREIDINIESNTHNELRKNLFNQKKLEASIWNLKCKFFHVRFIKKDSHLPLAQYQYSLNKLSQDIQLTEQPKLKILKNQIMAHFNCLYRQLFSKYFDLSKCIPSVLQLFSRHLKHPEFILEILIRFTFTLVCIEKVSQEEFDMLKQAFRKINQYRTYFSKQPGYWKICLANHYYVFKFENTINFKYLEKTLSLIRPNIQVDNYFTLRYSLLEEYEYMALKNKLLANKKSNMTEATNPSNLNNFSHFDRNSPHHTIKSQYEELQIQSSDQQEENIEISNFIRHQDLFSNLKLGSQI